MRWGGVLSRALQTSALVGLLFAGSADAQTGAGSVLWKKKGDFNSSRKPGDNAGIQAALDSVGPGGTVQIDAGRYQITATLRSRYAGVNIVATSDSVVFENASVSGDTILVITGAHTTVRGIAIDGRKSVKSDGYGIHVEAPDVTLEKLWIYNTPDAAIHGHQGSHRLTVKDCRIEYPGDATATVADGVIVHDSDDAKVIKNRITGAKRYGVWVQGTSLNTEIDGNTITGCLDDCIHTDNTAKGQNINGNWTIACLKDGIEQNSDSSIVSNNIVLRNPDFGIWSVDGGDGSAWWGNICAYNGNYNMAIEASAGTISGWAIFSNFLIRPYGQQFEIQSANSGTLVRDVQFSSNYLIGPTITQLGNAHPALKLVPTLGGGIERVHYKGNVIKDPTNYGLWVTPITTGFVHDLVVKDNDFIGGRYGVRLSAGGSGNTAYISGNYYDGQSVGAESLDATSWTTDALPQGAQNIVRATRAIVEDTLRVNGPTVLLGSVTMPPPTFTDVVTVGKIVGEDSLRIGTSSQLAPSVLTGDVTLWSDLLFQNREELRWKSSSGASQPIMRVDSVNVIRVHPITGGHLDVYKTDGTLGTRFYGTGGVSITGGGTLQLAGSNMLSTSGNDFRIQNKDAAGNTVFRNAANSGDNVKIEDTGDVTVYGKVTAVDSLRSQGGITADGPLRANGAGYVTGAWDVGPAGAFTKTGSSGTVTIPTGGNRINFDFAGENLIGPTVAGGWLSFTANGGATKPLQLAASGSEVDVNGKLIVSDSLRVNRTSEFVGAVAFPGGITGSPTVNSDLTVNGKAVVRDSLRVMMPLKLGQTSGIPQHHIIGDGGGTSNDTVTVTLNATNISAQRSPKLMLQRGGTPHGVFQGGSLGPEIRVDQAQRLVIGALGTNTPTFSFQMTSGTTGRLAINQTGGGNSSMALDVSGAGLFSDSLRANKGLYLGGQFISKHLSATASLDFDLSAVNCQDLTITVTGAAVGDVVSIGVPNGSVTTDAQFTAWVSASNTVTVRACDYAGTGNPASGTFRADVWQH